MKKLLALLVAGLICFGNSAVLADNSQTEEILSSVKAKIGSTESYKEFTSSVNSDFSGTSYNFSWWEKEDDDNARLSVSVNSEGIITSYRVRSSLDYAENGKPSINRPTEQEALATAISGFEKLNPTICDKVVIKGDGAYRSLGNDGFFFSVTRTENGIPVYGDSGRITVSADAKRITSLYLNYTQNLDFEDVSAVISKENAIESHNEKFPTKLRYGIVYDDKNKKAVLEYLPEEKADTYIGATSGEPVEIKAETRYSVSEDASAVYGASGGANLKSEAFSKAETVNLETLGSIISLEEATKIALSNKVVTQSCDYKLQNHSLTQDYYEKGEYVYELVFAAQNRQNESCLDICVSANSKNIISFYTNAEKGGEKTLSRQEAIKKADEAVKSLAPSCFSEYALKDDGKGSGQVTYVRTVGGIECPDDNIRVSIDLASGNVTYYRINRIEIDFPSAEGVLSAKEAQDRLFEQVKYDVCYMISYDDSVPRAVAVYKIEDIALNMDAFNGKLKYAKEETKTGDYVDVEGHWAQTEIETLAEFGIGFAEKEFRPDEFITQEEFTVFLNSAFYISEPKPIYDGYSYETVYRRAVENGVLKEDEFAPEAAVTRSMGAKMMIRAMELEEVANLENLFVSRFADTFGSDAAPAAILCAMGVVNGDENGNFNPDSFITRADAAMMMYNYLKK